MKTDRCSSKSLDETIGRLIMVGVRGASPDDANFRADMAFCQAARCRAVILFDRDLATDGERNIQSPTQLAELAAGIRESLGADALIGVDQEGGAVARLDPRKGFALHFGADRLGLLDERELRETCAAQARQLGQCGINLNFAPCVDVNVTPKNPIIGRLGRAFSDDPTQVIACARTFIEEHVRLGVATCLKHFPGHGSTTIDSHQNMPDITETFDSVTELAPYRELLALKTEHAALTMVMTGHLRHRGFDASGQPASLSRTMTTGLLRTELGFDGVIVTDSLDMGAICAHMSPAQAAVRALQAGADLVLDCNNAVAAERPCPAKEIAVAIREAVKTGDLSERALFESAERIEQLSKLAGRLFSDTKSCEDSADNVIGMDGA